MVDSFGVTYHALFSRRWLIDGLALGGVAIAEAVATDDHVIDGVVVFLCHLVAGIEQVVAQRVELGEVYPQVCDLQQVWERTHTPFSFPASFQTAKRFSHKPTKFSAYFTRCVCVCVCVGVGG